VHIFALSWISWLLGLLAAIVGGMAIVSLLAGRADERVLSQFRTNEADEASHGRYLNLIEGLSLSSGVSEPTLLVIDSQAMNGFAVAAKDRSAIAVTSALLSGLELVELEAVLALLIVRIKNGDAAAATEAALIGQRFIDSSLVSITKASASRRMKALLDPERDLLGDQAAVGLTRYPPGLARAFRKIASAPIDVPGASLGTSHIWLVPTHAADSIVPVVGIETRIDALEV
jgi:heat shock protein HtpX